MSLWREAMLVAGKDLRIEARSRVTLYQVVPFGLIVVLLFAFALDPSRGVLARVAPGLFWVAVLLAALLAVSRSFQVETENAARDGLRLSGLDPAAVFLGKAGAIAVQLAVLEVALGAGVALLYDVELRSLGLRKIFETVGLQSPDERAAHHASMASHEDLIGFVHGFSAVGATYL